ncbi:hypothetical protein EC915_106179 [Pseudomonas sp. LP_7_YM]|nr:hypothetical protein EC915_106179 [Pseudomonas sp. LP_7_YM]
MFGSRLMFNGNRRTEHIRKDENVGVLEPDERLTRPAPSACQRLTVKSVVFSGFLNLKHRRQSAHNRNDVQSSLHLNIFGKLAQAHPVEDSI